jgi:molecular chaperone Hsp33
MPDRIVRAMDPGGRVRILAARTSSTVEESRVLHRMNPTPCAALGRLLTGAALMSCTLKNPSDTLTLQIRGDGPIGSMIAVADASAAVRGYAGRSDFDLPLNARGKIDVAGAVGKGMLHVIRDLGMGDPYVGSVNLVSGEIAEDLTWYYASSEQTPTVMALGVLIGPEGRVLQAGGLFIQLMPEAGVSLAGPLEKIVTAMPAMTSMLADGLSPEDIILDQFGSLHPEIIDTRPVTYRCNCSLERMERNLISLGRKELAELSEDPKGIELQCQFCSRKYTFSVESVKALTEAAKRP